MTQKTNDMLHEERSLLAEYITTFYTTIYPLSSTSIREYLEYSHLSGGKRYRGVLCLLFGCYFGGDTRALLPFAAAIEMIHSSSLIHDDLPALDNDMLRRGKKAHHIAFNEGLAILSGDALLTDAFYSMTLTEVPSPLLISAIRELSVASGSHGLIAGQMLDITYNEVHSVEEIHSLKTGALFTASCTTGALLAGATEEAQNKVRYFAMSFGLLFQIIDDILDEGEDTEGVDTQGQDTQLSKYTFIAMYGVEGAKEEARCRYERTKQLLVEVSHLFQEETIQQQAIMSKLMYLVDNVYMSIL